MGMFDGGGLNIAGHKIPPAALAVGAGVLGVILVMRMRSSGGGAAVGAARPYSSSGGYDAMQAGSLNTLSSQVNSLANSVQALQAKPAPSTPVSPPAITPGQTGFTWWGGHQYRWIQGVAGEGAGSIAAKFWGAGADSPGGVGVLESYNPGTSGANPIWFVPTEGTHVGPYGGSRDPASLLPGVVK